ncbi:MAG: hypothetical protein HY327_11345 [Chloroflexi bacterium]|nr:hypothetical protein [Chloroflexota bacterium]
MPHLKLPVVQGNQVFFPKNRVCPWCRKNKIGGAHGMAVLNAGAMRKVGKERYEMANDTAAFFTLTWHGDHSDASKEHAFATIDVADMVESGQFDLYFCSTDCLRGFLNYCVDELEQRVKKKPRKKRRSKTKPRKP